MRVRGSGPPWILYVVRTFRTERAWIQETISLIWFPSSHLVPTVPPSALVHRSLLDFPAHAKDVRGDRRITLTVFSALPLEWFFFALIASSFQMTMSSISLLFKHPNLSN